jgi:RHS repeat-associated protein
MNSVNVSVFSPIARQNLVEVNHINTFDKDITLTFTATESSTQFYITKGWSVAAVTPLESITLDYLYIQEHESQQMEINCEVLNSTITYLLNTGVNMADSNTARSFLNHSFKRNLSYAAYQQAITSCANTPGVNTLAEAGVEYEEVRGGYRFGFNGKEKDDEVVGSGNSYDYGFRIYNPKLGRFLSVDPLTNEYPWWTPYQFAGNRPIDGVDLDGLEYLDADEARVEFKNGRLQIKVENFLTINRNAWNTANGNPANWKSGQIGLDPTVAHVKFNKPVPEAKDIPAEQLPSTAKGQTQSGVKSQGINPAGRR